jgi:preprotein translocase SecE subunit
MSTVNHAKSDGFRGVLFSINLYKRNQGRVARQLVAGAGAVLVCLLCWAMSQSLMEDATGAGRAVGGWLGWSKEMQDLLANLARSVPPALCLVAGLWAVFRAVNYPQFAEFLIEVQHEMAKVSWPGWPQLQRSTAVVLFTMGLLGVVLFCYDVVWHWALRLIHVLQF